MKAKRPKPRPSPSAPAPKEKRKVGRPSRYTEEIAEEICLWIAQGKTLRDFCRMEGNPSWNTVYDWLEVRPEFSVRFARARDHGADAISEHALSLIDTKPADAVEAAWRRNQVELRLKLLAKWSPKKWGDKATVTHEGGDTPIKTEDVTPTEAGRKVAFVLAAAAAQALKEK